MKAVVVPQPKATLIAFGVKTILDLGAPPNGPMRPDGVRGLPGLAVERGERIAFVAGAAKPKRRHEVHWGTRDDPIDPLIEANEAPWLWTDYDDGTGGSWQWWSGPLGAVVCTVEVADALRVVRSEVANCNHRELHLTAGLDHRPRGRLWDARTESCAVVEHAEVTDQLPLGDFTPGRWGWMLTDPRPCDPIPCKGRPGVFEVPEL